MTTYWNIISLLIICCLYLYILQGISDPQDLWYINNKKGRVSLQVVLSLLIFFYLFSSIVLVFV